MDPQKNRRFSKTDSEIKTPAQLAIENTQPALQNTQNQTLDEVI